MTAIPDNYAIYYADKLWNLLPAVYRAQDTDQFGSNGPLRELVNRIGAQAANVRRNIDRLWEDQSIETCDDWVIPYIGALLGTNLVSGLDPRSQRIDVAKTIYFRRRKGTLAILEEIAFAITGWDAKVVEFFRRMGRTRHGLDPAIGTSYDASGAAATLQVAEGLLGATTHTGIGGFADVRNAYGASKAGSAFDEFFHTADTRQPLGNSGWYNIPRLGIFLWRLGSYGVGPVTPVAVAGCHNWYSFDPTGRDIPLFGAERGASAFGDNWVSPAESQLPTPISQTLLDTNEATTTPGQPANLYPGVMSVAFAEADPADEVPIPANRLTIRPQRGRFLYAGSPPAPALVVNYHYGFPSDIGAGPYDRRGSALSIATPAPAVGISGGGTALAQAGAIPAKGTLTLGDMLTYRGAADVPKVDGALTLRSRNQQRPLIRLGTGAAVWSITGTTGSTLTLDGLFISGNDVVLRGAFDSVTLSCCTLDPGSAAAHGASGGSPPAAIFAVAADGRPLVPTRLWIEATVATLTIDRCVLGGVRTRNGGLVEAVTITNSILQAIPSRGDGLMTSADIKDPERLETRLAQAAEAQSTDLVANRLLAMEPGILAVIGAAGSPPHLASPPSPTVPGKLLELLNLIVMAPTLYDQKTFAGVPLSAATQQMLGVGSPPSRSPALNRALLDDAFPLELADAALAFGDGVVNLSRCTVLGRIAAHQLEASESILWDLSQIDDAQTGCVRFCAWADGSVLPRKFESVRVHQQAPLFTSTDFGQPGYCQLTPLVDDAIMPDAAASPTPSNTMSAGAVDGSEMGAFARDKNPIKERGLLLKYQEYMPAGLVPVIVHVT
jgi:hypothetical protein